MPVVTKGLEGVVANSTRLSDVIGDKGQLVYCGYDINELAGKVSYEEVVYLLWNNRLPNRAELTECEGTLRALRQLPEGVIEFLKGAPQRRRADGRHPHGGLDAGPLRSGDRESEATPEMNRRRARSITAKIGVIAAYFHRARERKPLPPVRGDLERGRAFPLPDERRSADARKRPTRWMWLSCCTRITG